MMIGVDEAEDLVHENIETTGLTKFNFFLTNEYFLLSKYILRFTGLKCVRKISIYLSYLEVYLLVGNSLLM